MEVIAWQSPQHETLYQRVSQELKVHVPLEDPWLKHSPATADL